VPDLPPHFLLPRKNDLRLCRGKLLGDSQRKVAITAIRGMGGIGKTVLAILTCRDEKVRQRYSDGVFWVTVGQEKAGEVSKALALQANLANALTGQSVTFENRQQGKDWLRSYFKHRACLLVLDDVWDVRDALWLDVVGPQSRILVTTREGEVVTDLEADEYPLDVLVPDDAIRLLAECSRKEVRGSADARKVIEECGRLPLALSICGALARDGLAWTDIFCALKSARLDFLKRRGVDPKYQSVLRSVEASVSFLAEEDGKSKKCYLDFAVFPPDKSVPEETVLMLWREYGGLELFEAERLLVTLRQRSLLSVEGERPNRQVSLHDLHHKFVRDSHEDLKSLHNGFLEAYRNKYHSWANVPDDGYYFQHLSYHLQQAGRVPELRELLLRYDWLKAKLQATDVLQLLADFTPQPPIEEDDLLGPEQDSPWRLLQGALRLSAHILDDDPMQLCSQLYARLLRYTDPVLAGLLASATPGTDFWLRPLASCLDGPVGPLMRTLKGHVSRVTAVGLTPDGKQVVSCSEDKTLRVWDWESGECKKTLTGHRDGIAEVSILSDLPCAVSASRDKTLKVWDVGSDDSPKTLTGHADVVRAVAAIPGNKRLIASASWDNTLRVWDSRTGKCVSIIPLDWRHWCHSLATTPDGQYVISGSEDTTLKIWNLETRKCEQTLEGHTGRVNAVTVTPDGKHILSASNDRTVRIWDMQHGACVKILKGHKERVTCVSVAHDGRVVSGSEDKTLVVWDMSSGEMVSTLERHSDRVTAVAVTADGRRAISASADETLKVWNIEPGTRWEPWAIHSAEVSAICFTPDGRAVSGSEDRTLKVWDVPRGECLLTLSGPSGHERRVNAVAAFPNGRYVVSASSDATLRIWDLDTPDSKPRQLRGNGDWFSAVSVVPSGDHVLSVSLRDSALTVWNVDTGERTRISPNEDRKRVDAKLLNRLGSRVRVHWDSTLKLWTVHAGDRVEALRGRHGVVSAVGLTEDGMLAALASQDYSLLLRNLQSGEVLNTLRGHRGRVTAVSLTNDGMRAASASVDRTVRVWDLEHRRELASFAGDAPITACCVASDGVTIAAGDQGGRVCFLCLQGEGATIDTGPVTDQAKGR
jgi:WD40 repeat protein